jgi:hypothetical protein
MSGDIYARTPHISNILHEKFHFIPSLQLSTYSPKNPRVYSYARASVPAHLIWIKLQVQLIPEVIGICKKNKGEYHGAWRKMETIVEHKKIKWNMAKAVKIYYICQYSGEYGEIM